MAKVGKCAVSGHLGGRPLEGGAPAAIFKEAVRKRGTSTLSLIEMKSVACPRCGAKPGQDCFYAYMGESRDGVHGDRKRAAGELMNLERATSKKKVAKAAK